MFWKLPAAKHLMQFRSPIQGLIIRGEIWGESQIKALQIKGDTSLYINTQTKHSFSFWFAKFLLVVHFNNHVVSVLIPYATWGSVLTLAVSFLRNKISENIFALFSRISLESYDLRMDSPVLQPVTTSYMLNNLWDVQTLNTMRTNPPARVSVSLMSYVKPWKLWLWSVTSPFPPPSHPTPSTTPPLPLCVHRSCASTPVQALPLLCCSTFRFLCFSKLSPSFSCSLLFLIFDQLRHCAATTFKTNTIANTFSGGWLYHLDIGRRFLLPPFSSD